MHSTRKIKDDLIYVGGSDRRLSRFENLFPIPRGVSYNSYVLLDEKTVLFDTADDSIGRLFCENVTYALDGRALDYLVVQHMEPDHCSLIDEMLRRYPEAKIVCSAKALSMLAQFYGLDAKDRALVVAEGDKLSTGQHTLHFIMAPMVHWPEVMVTYDEQHKLLFSADAFGTFGALAGNIFDDEINFDSAWMNDARRYYTNIVGKYGAQVQALLKKAAALDIETICPLHGPVWRGHLALLLEKYQLWSTYQPEKHGVMVAYASIHGNTAQAAEEMAELLRANGEEVEVFDLSRTDVSLAVRKAFYYDRMVLAAATYDGGVFPCMEEFLLHLKSKNFQKRTVGLMENGSWAPLAGKIMRGILEPMKDVHVLEQVVTIKSAVHDDTREAMKAMADALK